MGLFKNKGQAATELAVFGSILIFVIGSIIRTSIQAGMDQNQSLKAMRWALNQSLRGIRAENKSRDSANLLVIEDRLSPDVTKAGLLERVPTIQAGSGTFSNTLFMPLDWGETWNISVMDVFVNGEHFAFSTARFIIYDIEAVGDQIRIWDLTNDIKTYVPKVEDGNWKSHCLRDPDVGCPIFYSSIPVNSSEFCTDENTCDNSVISFNQRFDLNLNFFYDDDPKGSTRENMMWQWKPLIGVVGNIKINTHDGVYMSQDIDYDRKEEVIYAVNGNPLPNEPAIIDKRVVQRVAVLDSQKGDINLAFDDTDKQLAGTDYVEIGLQKDVSVYTKSPDGTYLAIRQGKAFNPETGNFVRSINKKDQVDVISRMFQLSNDTGRFCPPSGRPYPTIGNEDGGLKNPVEACVNSKNGEGTCYDPFTTISQTCFDKGTKMLFIRSRIQEQRGRKWVTHIEE